MDNNLFNVDDLLNNTFKRQDLNALFEAKLEELKLTKTAVQEILDIPYRTLNGILTGTQKTVDVINLIKLADFLHLPKEQVFELYVSLVQKKFNAPNISAQKIKYIKDNFDLTVLKKAGLITSVTDFVHIEKRIIKRLGFKSIYEYKKPKIDVAFSSGIFKPKNLLTRLFWIRTALCTFEEINNPYEYDREGLVKFFAQIRWYSLKENLGLVEVIKSLFKLGITVIYQPPLQGLQLRGATFSANGKPCIVLTNYLGFYSTLWFCLIHELYHVLFDWKEIKHECYHLSDDDNEELTVKEREKQADDFARKYLFSNEKLMNIRGHFNNADFIEKVAAENHVHRSIIYAFHAFDTNDPKYWARTKRYSPDVSTVVKEIDFSWSDERPFEDVINEQKQIIYN